MHPKIVEIPLGPLSIPINSYGMMILIGFVLGTLFAVRKAKKLGITPDLIYDVGIYSMLAGLLGGKINYIIQYHERFDMGIFDIFDGGLNYPAAIGFGIMPYLFILWRGRKRQWNIRLFSWGFFILIFLTVVFALIGARLVYLIIHLKEYNWDIITSWRSGFVFYGGVILASLTGILVVKIRKASIAQIADIAAPSLMMGLGFGRIGCFLNGCCFGRPSELPWAMSFPKETPVYLEHERAGLFESESLRSLPVHPTQLYESLAAFVIFFVLLWVSKKKRAQGEVFLWMGIFYPLWRFFVEFLRGDNEKILLNFLTYSQIMSIIIFVLCLVWLSRLRRRTV
jgi:phosphatidylglycerol:prolipoprotein diacylglycerol transferase